MNVIVTDRAGATHRLHAEMGWKLMEVIRYAGLPIKAECGGNCICSTCHVYVDEEWVERLPARSKDEDFTIELAVEVKTNSRLACQIVMTEALDNLSVTLAPEED
jgi:2Fe-2S ferredoxin